MKNTILISCPINSKSGYGYHSRDIVKSIFNSYRDTYEIKIFIVRWGNTPEGALDPNVPEDKELLDNIIYTPLPRQPEIFINISVPNEFQPVGKYVNIGITAGIETSMASQEWVEGCNKMDLIIVPSEHSKAVFVNSAWEKRNSNTNELLEIIKMQKPIEVVFEGNNTTIFNTTNVLPLKEIDEIPEEFLFLVCGHWLPGEVGEDRKNMGGLVKTFLETFKDQPKKPALLLKVSSGTYSMIDYHGLQNKINNIVKKINSTDLPNIYIMHGDLSDTELNSLYNHTKIKAMISFTKGEGYGRPLAEFSVTGKPIIASKWSGQLDFLSAKYCKLIPGTIAKVHPSVVWEKVIIPESSWFNIDYNLAKVALQEVYTDYENCAKLSANQAKIISNFTLEKMEEKLKTILDAKFEKIPVQMEFKLPTLTKI